MFTSVLLLAAAQLATAHFNISYPVWRADTLTNSSYSQYVYPCGGPAYGAGPITEWPISGGSLKVDLHHPWTYMFVNLGLGANTTNFNISLTPNFINETGAGMLCLPKLPTGINVTDGQLATLQVVTLGESGSALYNCADVKLTSSASTLNSSQCVTEATVTYSYINQEFNGSTTTTSTSNTTSTSASASATTSKNAAAAVGVNTLALSGVAGLVAFAAAGIVL